MELLPVRPLVVRLPAQATRILSSVSGVTATARVVLAEVGWFLVDINPRLRDEYEQAWAAWQKQLTALHGVFLSGESLDPPQLKGLLNREARAKVRYDAARLSLLGLSPEPERSAPAGETAQPEVLRPPGPR